MKRSISILFVITLSFILVLPMHATAEKPIDVFYNGEKLSFSVDPLVENGTTLVPFRVIFEKLGLEVGWDQATQTVTGNKDGLNISFRVGEKAVFVNGEKKEFTIPTQVINGTTLVPLRFISEVVGKQVDWDAKTYSVHIKDSVPMLMLDGELIMTTDAEKILTKLYNLDIQSSEYFVDIKGHSSLYGLQIPVLEMQLVVIEQMSPFEVSQLKGTRSLTILGNDYEEEIEIFSIDGKTYSKDIESGKWTEEINDTLTEDQFNFDFNDFIKPGDLDPINTIESNLVGKYIDLRVEYNAERFNQLLKESGETTEFSSLKFQFLIDPTTWYPTQTKGWITLPIPSVQNGEVTVELEMRFFSINKIDNIKIPDDLKTMIYK